MYCYSFVLNTFPFFLISKVFLCLLSMAYVAHKKKSCMVEHLMKLPKLKPSLISSYQDSAIDYIVVFYKIYLKELHFLHNCITFIKQMCVIKT